MDGYEHIEHIEARASRTSKKHEIAWPAIICIDVELAGSGYSRSPGPMESIYIRGGMLCRAAALLQTIYFYTYPESSFQKRHPIAPKHASAIQPTAVKGIVGILEDRTVQPTDSEIWTVG